MTMSECPAPTSLTNPHNHTRQYHNHHQDRSNGFSQTHNHDHGDDGDDGDDGSTHLVKVPAFPLASFMWPARGSMSKFQLMPLVLMVAALYRWAAGLWGHSGQHRPPMYGDYEAQRHWMELTVHLPVSQWYFHDLEWWGLDYPPLTALHSWVCGQVGSWIKPEWFALYESRGLEDPDLKVYMRATVIITEFLVYVPAVMVFCHRFGRLSGVPNWPAAMALVAVLMQPATILIDHVHFQYNTAMLGLVVASMSSMLAGRYMVAAGFFVAALAFKQMALYYALPVFTFLLGACIFPRVNVPRFLGIAAATVITACLMLLPILGGTTYDFMHSIHAKSGGTAINNCETQNHSGQQQQQHPFPLIMHLAGYLSQDTLAWALVEQLAQIVHRVFPFARGLFEDKVANFWCALNAVIKLRRLPAATLQKLALGATMAAIIPPNALLMYAFGCGRNVDPHNRRAKQVLPLALAATAWGFFLFSYQVHEKSVLLPLLPMTLLLAGTNGLAPETRAWVGFANMLGCWTMFPLLERVHLRVPYAVLSLTWAYLLGVPPVSWELYFPNHNAHGLQLSAASPRRSSDAGSHENDANVSRCDGATHFKHAGASTVTVIARACDLWSRYSWNVTTITHTAFYAAMLAWHVLKFVVLPPPGKPDLWVVVNVAVGAAGFALCYIWCLWRQGLESGAFAAARRMLLSLTYDSNSKKVQ